MKRQRPRPRSLSLALALGVLALAAVSPLAGCHRDGCVGGDDGQCLPPSACPALVYPACMAPSLHVEQIGPNDPKRVTGPKALAAEGDYLLENDLVRVVLDAPDHPHFIGPTGGAILDLAPLGPSLGDQTNAIYHAAGVLPRDAVHYESAAILDSQLDPSAPGAYAAVIFRGHLEGDSRVTVVTRYELRPCEPGVRVRSDLYNGAPDPNTLFLGDAFFWGDNGLAPFVPGPGLGFTEPDLDLLHIDQAWRQWPFLAARSQAAPDTAYAAVTCDRSQSAGFNKSTLTASGVPLGVTQPGDGFHFERFILAEAGPGLAPAVAEALHVRTLVHGDPPAVTVRGRVIADGAPVDPRSGSAASLLFYEPAAGPNVDDPTRITPWNEVVPAIDGTFQVSLPPNRSYRVQPYAFGLPAAAAASFTVAGTDVSIGDVTITASAELTVNVESSPGVPVTYAELVLVPFDAPPATGGPSLYSLFPGCAPMLGPPDSGSPACNRALVSKGSTGSVALAVPPGHYFVYGTRGPFASLDRAEVNLAPGTSSTVTLQVESLASQILPSGVVSGDFHVHGGASFDTSIPDQDRVVSFLATGVDVIIATDHNVVTNYASILAMLGATNSIVIIPGVEQTPNILWYYVPGDTFPKTLGHFNFWPLVPDFLQTRNGAPWPELREPGQVMDDMDDAAFANPTTAVRQLNHPYLLAKLGRDQGYPQAIGYDPTTPIPATPTSGFSFAANALARAPGGRHRNIDWDVEEVMTGASRADWLRYRALWFSLLNQGFKRVGTANSDSHSLSIERVGYPRNLVWGGHDQGTFDVDSFDADVRAGHLVGTNGPVLDVTIDDGGVKPYRPDMTPIKVSPTATLKISVSAAPWIPVTEARVFVNGALMHTFDLSSLFPSSDPFGTRISTGAVSLQLATLLPDKGDAWLVVEAGLHQDTPADTDGDGLPDLPDGDLPGRPALDDPRFNLQAIAPGVWPTAFSNPFFLDLDGGGWTAPGLP